MTRVLTKVENNKLETFKKENPAAVRFFKSNRTQFHVLNIKLDEFMCDLIENLELRGKKDINPFHKNLYLQQDQRLQKKYNKVL